MRCQFHNVKKKQTTKINPIPCPPSLPWGMNPNYRGGSGVWLLVFLPCFACGEGPGNFDQQGSCCFSEKWEQPWDNVLAGKDVPIALKSEITQLGQWRGKVGCRSWRDKTVPATPLGRSPGKEALCHRLLPTSLGGRENKNQISSAT